MSFLIVIMFINGIWVPGEKLPGWSAIPYKSFDECVQKSHDAQAIADKLMKVKPNSYPKRWSCLTSSEYNLWLKIIEDDAPGGTQT